MRCHGDGVHICAYLMAHCANDVVVGRFLLVAMARRSPCMQTKVRAGSVHYCCICMQRRLLLMHRVGTEESPQWTKKVSQRTYKWGLCGGALHVFDWARQKSEFSD